MAWFDSDYSYKKKITIDHTKVVGDETDFPVLVSVTDNDLRDTGNGGHVESANGYDIIFSNSAEDTQLKHEIEKYTNTNGLLVFWVKIPALSSVGDTDFYIYYGKAGVMADPSSTDTWDSDFLAVYHMDSTDDSTSNGYDLTNHGASLDGAGKTGTCYNFEASDPDYMDNATLLDTVPNDEITFEAWVKAESSTRGHIISKTNTIGEDFIGYQWRADDKIRAEVEGSNGGEEQFYSAVLGTGTWYYTALTYKKDAKATLYTNKNTVQSAGNIDEILDGNDREFVIGAYNVGLNFPFDGLIDEVRVSKKERSSNWLDTTYETQNDPGNFMSWGNEQVGGVVYTPCECSTFTLYGTSTAILFPKPEWANPNNKISKNVDLFNFRSGDLDTVDRGIDAQPLTIGGTVRFCGNGDWQNTVTMTTWLNSIKNAMNNGETFEINELGNCLNGIYTVRDFVFNTIKGTPNGFRWSLYLERVKDT